MTDQQIRELFADKTKLAAFLKGVLSGNVPSEYKTSLENSDAFAKAFNAAMNTPTGKSAIADMLREKQTERFVKRNKPFFDALLSGADLATSLNQIRQSNKAIKALQKPALPTSPGVDPAIDNAISQAQQGNIDVLRALEPAKQEIAQQRLMDMQTAKSVSGGQAGAYGANATAASLRANRAAAGLVPLGDSIRARQQGRLDNLLGVRQRARQDDFQNRYNIAQTNLGQYQSDVAAAAGLGQAGRQNLRMTLGQLPDLITRSAGNMLPIDNVWDAYGSSVEQNLADGIVKSSNAFRSNNTRPQLSPQYQMQAPDMIRQGRNSRLQGLRDYTANQYQRTDFNYPRPLY